MCSIVGLAGLTAGGYFYYTKVMRASSGPASTGDGLTPDLGGEFDGVGVGVAAASTRTDEMLRRYNPDYTGPTAVDPAAAEATGPREKEGYEPGEVEMSAMTSGDYEEYDEDDEEGEYEEEVEDEEEEGEEIEEEDEEDEDEESSAYETDEEEVGEEGVELELESPSHRR